MYLTLTCIELNSAFTKYYCIIKILCTATDVGIYGLLASQLCYHSKLVPCWFTLWTSSRFPYPYILLISLEIFLFSLNIYSGVHDSFRSLAATGMCQNHTELYAAKEVYLLILYKPNLISAPYLNNGHLVLLCKIMLI